MKRYTSISRVYMHHAEAPAVQPPFLWKLTGRKFLSNTAKTRWHLQRHLFHSDGLGEAHNSSREMFSFPRLKTLLEEYILGAPLIDLLRSELKNITGEGWDQEEDITIVALQRKSL